jgi:hypothetical protein
LSRGDVAAPLTAAALLGVQVASNAARDGLFLSWFPVNSLPYFITGSALLALPAALWSGRLLAWFGPARVVPVVFALSGVLFLLERALLSGQPRLATTLLYLHSSVLGAIAISAYWSLLNERFDPYSAKALMARVAGVGAFGGLLGGIAAERVGALGSPAALLLLLGLGGVACAAGAVVVGRAMPVRTRKDDPDDPSRGWAHIRRVSLLRHLALVTVLAAVLAALVDYALKADAVAHFGRGQHLVRFFGLFYAAASLAAFVIQASLGRQVLGRLGLGGSVAAHPVLVGASTLLGLFVPPPWRSLAPRGFDVSLRASVYRAGYELLYTPLPETTKRSAKSIIDVAGDSLGKGAGAVLILVLTLFDPRYTFVAVTLAAALVAAGELLVARRLRADYVGALQGGLVRHGGDLEQAAQLSLSDFTAVGSLAGLDRTAVLRAVSLGERPGAAADPVLAALADLRSGDPIRIRAALRQPPTDPLLIGALIPLLARRDTLRQVIAALAAFGPRAAGQLVDALLDPATPDAVRRRVPLALKSCPSRLAGQGLLESLGAPGFEVRLRCARALLALTDDHPELVAPPAAALAALERELAAPSDDPAFREHVFNLLALALEREPVRIAARAFETGDPYVRGTALEYLETVLSPALFSALKPRMAGADAAAPKGRDAARVRADLIDAGHTMRLSLKDVRRELAAAGDEEA